MNKTLASAFGFIILMLSNAIVWATPVPDTGVTKCYSDFGEITCPSPGQPFYGQDAQYTINPPSYTKLDGSGNVLSDSATSWAMVKDNVTGLIWENKTNDGTIHDKDNKYTWSDSFGVGTNTKDFIYALNSSHFGGYSDWRLPTITELAYIINYSVPSSGPTIDTGFFSNTVSSFYWSSTTYAFFTNYAWGVNFYYGYGTNYNKNSSYYVRAVRGGQPGSLGHLVIAPASQDVTKDAATTTFGVSNTGTGTMPWTAALTPDSSWLSITSGASGTDAGTITCSFTANTGTSARTATIRVTAAGATDSPQDVMVTQAGTPPPNPIIGSNSIDSMDVVKITDMSGLLPDTGSPVTVKAWDKDGKQLTAAGHASPLSIINYGTTSILGADLEDIFPDGTPAAYTFAVESSKMFITNINNSSDGAVRVPIIYSNGLSNFVSNSIGVRNTLKVTDMSGTIASGGIAITITAWDVSGKAIPESTSAEILKLYSHGTTTIDGKSLPARFPSGTPMTYEFTIASPKLIVSNVKNSSDGTLNIPTVYTVGVSNFVSNSIGSRNTLYISEFSGALGTGGAAIVIRAWDAAGTEIPESVSVTSYNIFNYETVKITGAELASRFSSGTPMTYEFTVNSSKVVITNVKSSSGGSINIPTVYTCSGITNYTTNYVSDLNTTIQITDMSGSIPTGGASITITARDVDGKTIPESGSAIALKLNNYGTTTIEGDDLQNRFPGGVPVTYEFSIGSSIAVVTNLTKSSDGTINIPTVFTIGPYGGI